MTKKTLIKTSVFFMTVICLLLWTGRQVIAQDIMKMKSGSEIKVSIIEETDELVKYREYDNPSGPVYTVSRDKVASIDYRKGSKPASKPVTEEPAGKQQKPLQNDSDMLVVKKRFVYRNDIKLNSRSIRALMEDNTEAIRLYESGKK